MKVICTNTCQKGRKTMYRAGKEYDIPDDMYRKNKVFFKRVEKKTENNSNK